MSRLSRGDEEALKQIFEEYFEAIYKFIRPRVDYQVEAEDVVSNVFLKLVSAFRNQKLPNRSLRGWLFKVARNELNDRYKDNYTIQTLSFDEATRIDNGMDSFDTELEIIRKVDIDILRNAVQQLTPDQQDVIVLRYGQLLSLRETADLLGKSINAVKVLQYRAIQSLRRQLEQIPMSVP